MSDPTNAGNNPERQRGSTDAHGAQRARRRRLGLSARGQRVAFFGGVVLLALLSFGWTWSIATSSATEAPRDTMPSTIRTVTAALTSTSGTAAAYVTNAALNALTARSRGASGKLRVKPVLPQEVDNALSVIKDFAQITLTPFSAKQGGRIGLYYIGNWPGERGRQAPRNAPTNKYANPRGFIEVTEENQDTPVSEHFKFRDFLPHDQPNVWPKYLVLQMENVDKLELVLDDLAGRGVNIAGVRVMSGFRTPQYNAGGGNTAGRAGLSRHMYGDAADIFIDNDGNGAMDDLNHDGRVDIRDARVIEESVNRVESAHPELIGGAGVYVACCGHGPFIHIDSRGYRARWTGTGGG